MHGYKPTDKLEDEEAGTTFEDLVTARRKEKTQFVIITGDFNAKIGKKVQKETHTVLATSL